MREVFVELVNCIDLGSDRSSPCPCGLKGDFPSSTDVIDDSIDEVRWWVGKGGQTVSYFSAEEIIS